MRAAIERQAQALQAQTLQAPPLQDPQMAPPLHQPLPSSRSRPATPYQQAVQPPSKPKGRGVTFNSSADKLPAMGGQDTDAHGRQRTRGQDDNTWSTRGMREGSSVRMTSKQMPCQGGEHPSGAPSNVPPAPAPVSTCPKLAVA